MHVRISEVYPDEEDSINREEHATLYTTAILFFRKIS